MRADERRHAALRLDPAAASVGVDLAERHNVDKNMLAQDLTLVPIEVVFQARIAAATALQPASPLPHPSEPASNASAVAKLTRTKLRFSWLTRCMQGGWRLLEGGQVHGISKFVGSAALGEEGSR